MTRQDNFGGRFGKGSMVKEPARTQPEKITIDSTRLQERMGCRVFRAADQTITTATPTLVSWTDEAYDRSGLHDTSVSNTRITIPSLGRITGQWLFHVSLQWEAGGTGIRTVEILQNGAKLAYASDPAISASFGQHMSLMVLVNDPNPGNYYEVRVEHTQGADLDVDTESHFECIHLW